jgi:hypothetical protein
MGVPTPVVEVLGVLVMVWLVDTICAYVVVGAAASCIKIARRSRSTAGRHVVSATKGARPNATVLSLSMIERSAEGVT